MARDDNGGSGGYGKDSKLRYCCFKASGTYRIRATYARGTGDDDGSYLLRVSLVDQHPTGGSDHVSAVEDEINVGGYCVVMPYGLETIAVKRMDPNNCAALGNDAACSMDLIDAVTIDGYVEQGIKFCFPKRGAVFYIPHNQGRGFQPQAVPYYHSGSRTYINRVPGTGKLLLARTGHAPSGSGGGSGGSAPAPRLVCNLDAKLKAGDRAEREGLRPSNLRNGPGTSNSKIGEIQVGAVVQVLEGPRSANGFKWYKIRTAGRAEGWVAESGNRGGQCGYWFVKTSKSVRDPGGSSPDDPIEVNSACSLHDAIDAANKDRRVGGCPAGNGADTINLRLSTILSRSLPNISSRITINGNNLAIDGDNRRSIFAVDKGASLTLNRVNLRNAYSKDSRGAALVNNGTTTIVSSNITGNSAGKDGGAISNKGTLTINSTRLTQNSSAESGGAIRNDGTLTVNNSSFNKNKASEPGGAIRNKGTLRLTGGAFSGNQGESGGAISNANSATISDAIFRNNTATCVGGAIHNSGDSIRVRSGSFSGNSPDTCHGVDCGSGAEKPVKDINYNLIRKGELGCSSAYNLYSFAGKKDEIVKISMERESGTIAPALSLWNSSGAKLAEDANTRTDRNALIANFKLPSTGTYTISANNFHDGAGSYFISVTDEVTYVLPEETAKEVAKDLEGFHTSEQLAEAGEQMQSVVIAACDMVTSLGWSKAAQLKKATAKEVIKHVAEDLLIEGLLRLNDYSVEQIRRARDEGNIPELIPQLAAALELVAANFPTGPCSLAFLAQDVLIGDALLEMMDEIYGSHCEIYSSKTVLAHNWPSADGSEFAELFLSQRVQPTGVVQLDGAPRFFMVHGKFGAKTALVGRHVTALFGSADDIGAVFIHEDYVTETKACQHAIDLTELVKRMAKPQNAKQFANPYVVRTPNPESGDCDLVIVQGRYAFYDTWETAMNPPVYTPTDSADDDVFRIYMVTIFPNSDGSTGSLFVRQAYKDEDSGSVTVSQDNPGGWLVATGTLATPLELRWKNGQKDYKTCLPGFSDGTWDRLFR